jgi:hypothetical protein
LFLVLKDGRLFDTDTMNFVVSKSDWDGHGNHDKVPVKNKSPSIDYIPYLCECGEVLIDKHESNSFKD